MDLNDSDFKDWRKEVKDELKEIRNTLTGGSLITSSQLELVLKPYLQKLDLIWGIGRWVIVAVAGLVLNFFFQLLTAGVIKK